MWAPQYDIIVETLTGSEFEVTVTDKDTVGYIKSRIQKYEGIPIGQQHLLYNHKELSDTTEMKDIPLGNGSRLKLVLDMKGGPVSARRVVNLPDYDSNWFDLSDVLNTNRHDPLTISTSGMKVLVYKDCKKNVHRIMKLRSDRKAYNAGKSSDTSNSSIGQDDQWVKDNIQTLEKMHQVRMLLEEQKKGKDTKEKKDPTKSNGTSNEEKINENNTIGVIAKSSQIKSTVVKGNQCLKVNKQETQSIGKPKLYPSDLQNRKTSCGLLNKYGLNKTCIRPPSLIPQPNKSEGGFQLHALAPLSLPPPTYSVPKMSNSEYLAKYQTAHVNIIKGNCNNVTINPPKRKDYIVKIRENIRRNRSFKAINDITTDDAIQRPFNVNSSLSSVLDQIVNAAKTTGDDVPSKSMYDLIEKMSTTSLSNNPDDFLNENMWNTSTELDCEKEILLPKRPNCTTAPPPGFENKFFVDRQTTVGINSLDNAGCVPDFKLENASSTSNSALDGSYRMYKMSSEAKNNYELPKLLIREDSPVESFHSSDPQLETLTIRGDSPKNVVDAYQKLTTPETTVESTERDSKPNKSIVKSPWSHHHSDLGLNNLELNFLNEEYSDLDTETATDSCIQSGSVLKIASNLEISRGWNNSELDGQSQPSTTSLNFINGDLTSSDDEEDVFNGSCCMLHNNSKSKSIELNDFRMMFGSSPTLLNSDFNSTTHASRLDAVPIQYRRGYTNLNDACLSSSTSDLELFNGTRKKISSKSASQELPSSFTRHRTNNSLDFIRSYENLDRAKIIRMKNERSRRNLNGSNQLFCWDSSTVSSNSKRNQSVQNNFSRERLQEEELCDDNFSYSNLGYENAMSSSSSAETNLPIDYPSDENLFNMNLERFADEFSLLSAGTLSDKLPIDNNDVKGTSQGSLILPDVEISTTKTRKAPSSKTSSNSCRISNLSETGSKSTIKKSDKLRCAECNKKLGLMMIMKCHCEKVFCPQHRYAEAHNCSYNFKSEGRKILSRENPLVVAPKLPKI